MSDPEDIREYVSARMRRDILASMSAPATSFSSINEETLSLAA